MARLGVGQAHKSTLAATAVSVRRLLHYLGDVHPFVRHQQEQLLTIQHQGRDTLHHDQCKSRIAWPSGYSLQS